MSRVAIYGASDDLVEIEGNHPIAEEYGPDSKGKFRAVITDQGDEGAILSVEYVDPGVWMVGLAPYDEGYVIPDEWAASLTTDPDRCAYSAVLLLDLPHSVVLEVLDGTDPRTSSGAREEADRG